MIICLENLEKLFGGKRHCSLIFKTKDGRFIFGIFNFQAVRFAVCAQNDFDRSRSGNGVREVWGIGFCRIAEHNFNRQFIFALHVNINSGERQAVFNSVIGRHRAEFAFENAESRRSRFILFAEQFQKS